jgi:hypothetical protein
MIELEKCYGLIILGQLKLRVTIQERLSNEDNAHLCLEELKAINEKHFEAQQRLECY